MKDLQAVDQDMNPESKEEDLMGLPAFHELLRHSSKNQAPFNTARNEQHRRKGFMMLMYVYMFIPLATRRLHAESSSRRYHNPVDCCMLPSGAELGFKYLQSPLAYW